MERFFEAWVESLADGVSRRIGAVLRAGRTEATRVPLNWEPRGGGGLRSLLPDLVLARSDRTIVIDAKYKPHGEELGIRGGWTWSSVRCRWGCPRSGAGRR